MDKTHYIFRPIVCCLVICLCIFVSESFADIIIDNDDPGTFYSGGAWGYSSGADPYGGSSRAESLNGATYTFEESVMGTQEVSLWWTYWSSRCSAALVDIYDGATLLATAQINQQNQALAGQWNVLGSYSFSGTARVVLRAQSGCSTSADAVRFILISGNVPPTAYIDSITPNPVDPGQSVSFSGYGTDDGSITGYSWESDIDGFLSDQDSFSTSSLSEGVHTISFKVKDDEEVWSAAVTAVLTVGTPPVEVIIDNDDPGTFYSGGAWGYSSGADPYGGSSRAERLNGATYTFEESVMGTQEVSLWWTYWSSRCSAALVDIYDGATLLDTVEVNQQQQALAGQWNVLGFYSFSAAARVVLRAQSGCSTSADAVRFRLVSGNAPPTAYIDSIAPNPVEPGQPVNFSGYGTDDGSITDYSWESDIGGFLSDQDSFSTSSLSEGVHTISFKVKDDEEVWSGAVTAVLTVRTPPVDVIIDNDDPGTFYSGGAWGYSSGAEPYGGSSRAESLNGATYTFEESVMGTQEVSLWWTYWSSRCSAALVDIYDGATLLATAQVNQQNQALAGQWNVLGSYAFSAAARVVLRAQSGCSTSADAVKFAFLSETPEAIIDMISPNPALYGDDIVFSGSGTDPDGSIVNYSWRSSIDGQLSDSATFNTAELPTGLSEGVHTIYFKVQDNEGTWSPEKNATLVYRSCGSPIKIMPLGDSITFDTFGDPRPNSLRTGYRQPLWLALEDEGYNMDFVGSFVSGNQATPFFDPNHEGHPGWRDDEIANGRASDPSAGKLSDWLSVYDPDIVLLHIGTNGLDLSPSDVDSILNIIDGFDEEIIVILARIINRSIYSQVTTDFNNNVQTMAEARIATGDKIIIVDMEDGAGIDYRLETNGGDMADNLHPNDNGGAKMAVVWFDALKNILPPCALFAPFIFTHPNTISVVSQSYTYQVVAIGNPQPTFSLISNPAGMSIDSVTGLIQWTPNSSQEGSHNVTVQAQSIEGTYTQTFAVEAKAPYSISFTVPGGNGTIACDPTEVPAGESSTCTITPNEGYALLQLSDNGADATDMLSGNTYVVSDINEDHFIEAAFAVGIIIDNDDPGTFYSGGAWGYSSGADPYGGSSRAESLNGATYTFEGAVMGSQEVSLWWTYWSSRCSAALVDIYDGATLLDTVEVNQHQQDLAGQWNVLGSYPFNGTARAVIRAQSSCSTSADAVKFTFVNP